MADVDRNILVGERVRLSAVREEDWQLIAQQNEDAGYIRLVTAEPARPQTVDQLRASITEMISKTNAYAFAIREIDDDRFVGFINVHEIDWTNQGGQLGIGIGDRGDWNKGYGTEAVKLALDFAFRELNLHRIGLGVFEYNSRAIAVYEKLGFVHEGREREALYKDGRRWDIHMYAMLRPEWEAQHPS